MKYVAAQVSKQNDPIYIYLIKDEYWNYQNIRFQKKSTESSLNYYKNTKFLVSPVRLFSTLIPTNLDDIKHLKGPKFSHGQYHPRHQKIYDIVQFSFFPYLTLCNSVNLGANESLVDFTPLKQLMVFPSLHHPSTLE